MKFKLKIICPECKESMILLNDNSLLCENRNKHRDKLICYRRIGNDDVIFEFQEIKEKDDS